MPRDRGRARSIVLGMLAGAIGVLAVTGVALFFLYRPTARAAWPGLLTEGYDWDVRVSSGLRLVHRLAAWFAVLAALATGVVLAVSRPATASRWAGPVLGAGIPLVALAGFYTGLLLPWDQLALSAVTADFNVRGYRVLFDPIVRFVLIGGSEVSPGTLLAWLLVHMLVLGPALAALVALGWRRSRRL